MDRAAQRGAGFSSAKTTTQQTFALRGQCRDAPFAIEGWRLQFDLTRRIRWHSRHIRAFTK